MTLGWMDGGASAYQVLNILAVLLNAALKQDGC
jgi:hypothetical protein